MRVPLASQKAVRGDDPNSTLAALWSLYRRGRLVLMGSTIAPAPINYLLLMFNSLDIIDTMYPRNAYLRCLRCCAPVSST